MNVARRSYATELPRRREEHPGSHYRAKLALETIDDETPLSSELALLPCEANIFGTHFPFLRCCHSRALLVLH